MASGLDFSASLEPEGPPDFSASLEPEGPPDFSGSLEAPEEATPAVDPGGPDFMVSPEGIEIFLLKKLHNRDPSPGKYISRVEQVASAPLITRGQQREKTLKAGERLGLGLTDEGKFDVRRLAFDLTPDVILDAPENAIAGLKKVPQQTLDGFVGALRAMEAVTWRPLLALSAEAGVKGGLQQDVTFALETNPSAPLLTANQYQKLVAAGLPPSPGSFLMQERDIDTLGSLAFEQAYKDMRPIGEEVYQHVGDISSVLLGKALSVGVSGADALNSNDVDRLIGEISDLIMDPVEKAMTEFAYTGELPSMLDPTKSFREVATRSNVVTGALAAAANKVFGRLAHPGTEGESETARERRWLYAMNEAIDDGMKGAQEMIGFAAMAVIDPSTLVSLPGVAARRLGINFTTRGAGAVDEALDGLRKTAREVVDAEHANLREAGKKQIARIDSESAAIREELLGADQVNAARLSDELAEVELAKKVVEEEVGADFARSMNKKRWAGVEEGQKFQSDTVRLVDAAFRHGVTLKGDARTLQAWGRFMDDAMPDVPPGLAPDSPEALADLRATYWAEAEAEFMDALRTANAEGRVLVNATPGGAVGLAPDASKRLVGVHDAARLRAGSWAMQQISKTHLGRKLIGSRSKPGLESARRTTSALLFGSKYTQPLAGPNPVGLWHAYERGELLHPAAFADLVDGLARHNRSAELIADQRRAYFRGLTRDHPDQLTRIRALEVIADGDQGRIVAAAEKLKQLDSLSTDGDSFAREFAASQEYMRGMKDLRDEVAEISQLLQSPNAERRAEGTIRLSRARDKAQHRAEQAAARAAIEQVLRSAENVGDAAQIAKALDESGLEAAFKALDSAGAISADEIRALAGDAAARARARVDLAMNPTSKKAKAWEEYLGVTADGDALLIKAEIIDEHIARLKTEIRGHQVQDLYRKKTLLQGAERRAVAAGNKGLLPDLRSEIGIIEAMIDEGRAALKAAEREAAQVAQQWAKGARATEKFKPKGDLSEFVRDYADEAFRAAQQNVDDVNGLFERNRGVAEFHDLTPTERAQAVKRALGKRMTKRDVSPEALAASNAIRKMLRSYARDLHEHLVAQGVRGTTVDDVVANLDLERLLPKLIKADGLSMEQALRGQPVSPSYLAPGVIKLEDVGVVAEKRRAFAMAISEAWAKAGGTGSAPDDFVRTFLDDHGTDIAAYVSDPLPMISRFMADAGSVLADRQFIADLRVRFPRGQELANRFGWDGQVHADAIGFSLVDHAPLVGAHNKVRLPKEMRGQHDAIVSAMLKGKKAREVLELEWVKNASPEDKSKLYLYIKGGEEALEAPLYLPKPAAEFINWYYADGSTMRDRLEKALSLGADGRTLFSVDRQKRALEVFDGIHAWTKTMLTTFRSAAGYTMVNVIGNVTSGVQVAGVAAIDPTAHFIGAMVASGISPDLVVRLGRDTMTLRQFEREALEDGITSAAFSSAFRKEAGLLDPVSSQARDARLFGDSGVTMTSPERGRVRLTPRLDVSGEGASGGVWNVFANAIAESVPRGKDVMLGALGKGKAGSRKADLLALSKEIAKKEVRAAVNRALVGAGSGGMLFGPEGAAVGAVAGLAGATRTAGGFAGSLIGMPFHGVGLGGAVGALSAPGWVRISSELNGWVEHQMRIAIYTGMRQKGASRQLATRTVDEALRNYSAISPFERSTLRRMFGFWTWDAGNIRLQTSWAAKNPGAAAHIATLMSIYERGEFTDEELRQVPKFAQTSFLLNAGAGRIVSVRGAPVFDAVQSLQKKANLALVAGGSLLDSEMRESLGDLSAPLRAIPYFFGKDPGTLRDVDEMTWVGNKIGWTDAEAGKILPQYLLDMFEIGPPQVLPKTGGQVFHTTAPRRYAAFKQTPLNSILGAYIRVMKPPEDPRLVGEWKSSMEARLAAVAFGASLINLEKDPMAVKARDLANIKRELRQHGPYSERWVINDDRYLEYPREEVRE